MKRICILYHTTDGHTVVVCETIQEELMARDHYVTLQSLETFDSSTLPMYDTLILGASIRYGKHAGLVRDFLEANATVLQAMETAVFSINLVARKADKNTPETNPYMKKFLEGLSWQPNLCAVFAGKLDYARYGLLDRWMIRLIMKITHGPTETKEPIVYTNWDAVEAFAEEVAVWDTTV